MLSIILRIGHQVNGHPRTLTPEIMLYAQGNNGSFGQYRLDVTVTAVPEPAPDVLGATGLLLLIVAFRGQGHSGRLGNTRRI